MKGWLSKDKWSVSYMGFQSYLAERIVDDKTEYHEVKAHCLACAKNEVLLEYGGEVDLRGWHKQGTCGAFLRITASELKDPPEEE